MFRDVLVGESGDRIIATAVGGYDGVRGWVHHLAVEPSERRRSHGREIMNALEDELRALGCPKLNLQVRGSNLEVLDFYRALGYEQDDVVGLGKIL